jgi:type I restriction enzyme M protein
MEGIDKITQEVNQDSSIDIFGDAYEYLMSMYASNAGKSGGEFFTPQEVSQLLARLTIGEKNRIDRIYDPACGSGSLLLKAYNICKQRQKKNEILLTRIHGQECNRTTYNLCRMNMFLHNVDWDKVNIYCEDTLVNPDPDIKPESMSAIVSNPPYSLK